MEAPRRMINEPMGPVHADKWSNSPHLTVIVFPMWLALVLLLFTSLSFAARSAPPEEGDPASRVLRHLNAQRAPGTMEIGIEDIRELLHQASIPVGCTKAYCSLPKFPNYGSYEAGGSKDEENYRRGKWYFGSCPCDCALPGPCICNTAACARWADSVCDCEAYDEKYML
jgi:hypothetical protein